MDAKDLLALAAGLSLSVLLNLCVLWMRPHLARRIEERFFRQVEKFQGVSRDVFVWDPTLVARILRQRDEDRARRRGAGKLTQNAT